MFHTPEKKVLYTAYRLDAEHQDASGRSLRISGTAFFVRFKERNLLVTNRHNVDAPYKDKKYLGMRMISYKLGGDFGSGYIECVPAHHPNLVYSSNYNEDVAVFYVTGLDLDTSSNDQLTPVYIDFPFLADEESLN